MPTTADDVLVWRGLLTLLVAAPILSGSLAPLPQALVMLWVFALLAAWFWPHADFPRRQRLPPRGLRPLQGILVCWALAVIFAVCQVVPVPPRWLAALSPSLSDLYAWALPISESEEVWRPLSTTPGATIQSGLMTAACGAVFVLVISLCKTRKRILLLAFTVVLVGAGEAIYGLAQAGGSFVRSATGTFANRNHFSAFLGMALCLSMALLLYRWQKGQSEAQGVAGVSALPQRLDRWAQTIPLAMLSLTVFAGIMFSFSRMGLASPLVMLVLFGSLWLLGPVSGRIRLLGIGVGAVVLLLLGGAWPALELTAERFQSLRTPYRGPAWEGTYSLFQSSPIVGIGLGGLVDNLPRFLPANVQMVYVHSHSEPLEVLAEGGVVYGSLLAVGLVLYFGTLIPAWYKRRDSLARHVGLGCLAAVASVLLHSMTEFPLRTPSNAVYLCVIMGMGWAVILYRAGQSNDEDACPRPSRALLLIGRAIVLTAVTGGLALSAVGATAQVLDRLGQRLVARATAMPSGAARDALFEQSGHIHQLAHRIEPWQAVHSFNVGRAYELTAADRIPLRDDAQERWASAARSYELAVHRDPANARLQAALAWADLRSGDLVGARRAVRAALRLAPSDPHIRFAVTKWYLTHWDSLSEEEQRTVTALVHRGAWELPGKYVEAAWRLLRDPQIVRRILPDDLPARRLLLNKLTEGRRFRDRWAEQVAYPALRTSTPERGGRVIAQGLLVGNRKLPQEAIPSGFWTGLVAGWLSAGLTAKVELMLPPGEVVLYIPVQGEAAGGVWPILDMKLGGTPIPLPSLSAPGWRAIYVLLSTRGGRIPLEAVVTNGTVLFENGSFTERRAALGRVMILSAQHSSSSSILATSAQAKPTAIQ